MATAKIQQWVLLVNWISLPREMKKWCLAGTPASIALVTMNRNSGFVTSHSGGYIC